jgi:copper(I)-binding protein
MMKFWLGLCAIFLSSSVSAADILVTDAKVREPVPGRYMSAGFLTLKNTSDEARSLVSVKAPWAGIIEIHTHTYEDGIMKMRQLETLEIPADSSVVLKSGGLHLMLFRLQLPLADSLPMTLCFDNGDCVDTAAQLYSPLD